MQLCSWVQLDKSRCAYLSENWIYPIPTSYDGTYVYNICKETCGACDGSYDESAPPSKLPTSCEDDNTCFAIARGDKIMTLCEWTALDISTRCRYKSKNYVSSNTMPTTYDATFVRNICKETCGVCGDTTLSEPPASLPTQDTEFPTMSATASACRDENIIISSSKDKADVMLCKIVMLDNLLFCQAKIKEVLKDYTNYDFSHTQVPIVALSNTNIYNICKRTCGVCAPDVEEKSVVPSMTPSAPLILKTELPSDRHTFNPSIEPSIKPMLSPTLKPSMAPVECQDDNTCIAIARGDKIMTLCEWVIEAPSTRCLLKSENYVSPQTIPTWYDAAFIYNICQRSCNSCGGML